ncbi:MAG: DMT family transporter [Pseudomonadota bacterium]|nr:DMT family transporter [Pseudomonadota bacterium]
MVRSAHLSGIFWVVISSLCFVAVTGIVRHLGSDMNPIQAAFVRYAIGVALLLPTLLAVPRSAWRLPRLAPHALRGLTHGIGVMLWFFAMTQIPIADVTALGFTSPIFVTLGAALVLRERLRLRRMIAIGIGFAGMLVILRPGLNTLELGAAAMLLAAPLFAASMLLAKRLTAAQRPGEIVAFLSVFVTLVLMPPALYVWRAPTWEEMVWLTATAVFATLGHIALVKAYSLVEITVTQPVTFVQLVWASLLGYFVFAEVPDVWTIVGGMIIVASASYIAHRESQLARAARQVTSQTG